MKQLLKTVLLKKLREHDQVNYPKFNLDKNSYQSGYSNGFMQGFYLMKKRNIGMLIILIASLIFNLILLYYYYFIK